MRYIPNLMKSLSLDSIKLTILPITSHIIGTATEGDREVIPLLILGIINLEVQFSVTVFKANDVRSPINGR